MARIAVVDDDQDWGELFLRILSECGYFGSYYPTAGKFLDHLSADKPDLLLLDMQLPGMHGREIIRILRSNPATVKMIIIAVSGHDISSPQVIKAFEAGADEYLPKPVDIPLLKVRVEALLRRGTDGKNLLPSEIKIGDLKIYPERRAASIGKRALSLTNMEFELLMAFVKQPNRVLTRGIILETVWKTSADTTTRTVDKHVETLRKELGDFGKRIETVIGVGYIFRSKA
jgi:DNA-binding response OmpR family regulator